MAGSLHVRNLDYDLIARLKRRAARHGRSTEAEHREILRQALAAEVEPSFDALAADLRKRSAASRPHRKCCCARHATSGEHARPVSRSRHRADGLTCVAFWYPGSLKSESRFDV